MGRLSANPQRFWSLDILRGVCSLTVFANHWVLWANFPPCGIWETALHKLLSDVYGIFVALTWPTGGQHPALVCFFVLSGFCVHYPFEGRKACGESISWSRYFVRRAQRILPVYWVGSLLGLLVVGAMHWRWVFDPLLILHSAVSPGQIAARFGVFSGLWPKEVFVGNYILNTVGVEVLIYALYPLFFFLTSAGRWRLVGVAVVLMQITALALQPYFDPYVLFASVLVMGLFWYIGALVAHLHFRRRLNIRGWWIGGAWALFLAVNMTPVFYGRNTIRQGIWAAVCALLVGWLVNWEARNQEKRERPWSRVFQWFGGISYSLYAVHTPVILLANWTCLTLLDSRDYRLQLASSLVSSLVVTVVVHQFIERRFYRLPGATVAEARH